MRPITRNWNHTAASLPPRLDSNPPGAAASDDGDESDSEPRGFEPERERESGLLMEPRVAMANVPATETPTLTLLSLPDRVSAEKPR